MAHEPVVSPQEYGTETLSWEFERGGENLASKAKWIGYDKRARARCLVTPQSRYPMCFPVPVAGIGRAAERPPLLGELGLLRIVALFGRDGAELQSASGETVSVGGFDDETGGGHGGEAFVERGGENAARCSQFGERPWLAAACKGCGVKIDERFSLAARRRLLRSGTYVGCRAGELKRHWTEPLARCRGYGD
jgi:hypothetical protein